MVDTRSSLQQRLAHLSEEHEVVNQQIDASIDEGERVRLKRKAVRLLKEMAQVEQQIQELNEPPHFRTVMIDSPYRGLEIFREQDAGLFFGRTAQVADLLAKVTNTGFLAVLGASGSGKSSLVQAGLLHALKIEAEGAPAGSAEWRYATLKPGARPLDQLVGALAALANDTPTAHDAPSDSAGVLAGQLALGRELKLDSRAVLWVADLLLQQRPNARLVLIIDQAEELWTQTPADPEQQQPFIELLLTAADAPDRTVLVVLAMRADFFHRLLEYPALAAQVERHLVTVSPMQPDQLREVIEQPAAQVGGRFEPGLVDELIKQTVDREGALPLLQYTLTQLWAQRDANDTCTWAAFRAIGGVEGALAAKADAILKEHYSTPEQRDAVRNVLLRLVQPGEGVADTRRRVLLSDLVPAESSVEAVQTLLQPLTNERLITTGRDLVSGAETVEVSHEALIRAWPTLSTWIGEARTDLRFQIQLDEAAHEWHKGEQPDDLLWSGPRLANAEAWLNRAHPQLNARAQSFLDASRTVQQARIAAEEARRQHELAQAQALAEAERQRAEVLTTSAKQLRQRAIGLGIAFAVAAILGAGAIVGFVQAQQNAAEAQKQRLAALHQALVSDAQLVASSGDTDQALALTLAAIDQQPDNPPPALIPILYHVADTGTRRRFSGHTDGVTSVAFSPDGKTALSGSGDNTLRLWDVATGQSIRTFSGHTSYVLSVAFSPDGKTALSGSWDNTLRLWDVATGQSIRTFSGHTDSVLSVAFSPDGKTALSGSGDNTLRLWDVATGQSIRTFSGHMESVLSVAFSPDGKTALSGSWDNTLLLWNVASGQSIRTFSGHISGVLSVAFSPDGTTALSGSADTTMRLWNVATGQSIRTFSGHTSYVWSVAFSPDGKTALSGSWDKTLRLWDLATDGQSIRTFSGHTSGVTSVAFSPDGKTALSGSLDKTLRLWDMANGQTIRTFSGHTNAVYSVAFSPDGKTALSGSGDNTLRLWDVASGQSIRTFSGHMSYVTSVAFSPDGKTALSGSWDNTLWLWDVASGQSIRTFSGHMSYVRSVAFSPDGKTALSGSWDNTLRLWDVASGQSLRTFSGHTSSVLSVAFSSDGKTVLSGSDDKTLRLWDVASGQSLRTFSGHTDLVTSVAFSPDGKTVLSGSGDKTMRLWDVASGQSIRTFSGHTSYVYSVAFSPDGKMALAGSAHNTLRLWQTYPQSDMIAWVRANRYAPPLSCQQHQQYAIPPVPAACPTDVAVTAKPSIP